MAKGGAVFKMTEGDRTCSSRVLPSWLTNGSANNFTKVSSSEKNASDKSATFQAFLTKQLPLLEFPGIIHYHDSVPAASEACQAIISGMDFSKEDSVAIGFDLEWTVTFTAGREPRTSLLQICANHEQCHLFHLSAMSGFPKALRVLVEDKRIKKVGLGVESDLWKLGRDYNIPMLPVVEQSAVGLTQLANTVLKCSQSWSLDGLTQHLLRCRLSKEKDVRCGNWNRTPLSEEQMQYAALDAYVSLRLYEELMKIKVNQKAAD